MVTNLFFQDENYPQYLFLSLTQPNTRRSGGSLGFLILAPGMSSYLAAPVLAFVSLPANFGGNRYCVVYQHLPCAELQVDKWEHNVAV